jgi:hypothetical protein
VTDVARNRQASYRYHLTDKWECGIQLQGSEVKSIRNGEVQLKDAYAMLTDGEIWLHNMHIAPYQNARDGGHEPERPAEPFKAPTNAKYATIRGIREAFRPGTEPQAAIAPVGAGGMPRGPQPYSKVWQDGLTGAPNAGAAVAPPPPPPKKQDDLSDLF